MNALIIKKRPLELILRRRKTWELRGRRTSIRGRIGLVESGTGTVVGTCEVADVKGPLTLAEVRQNADKLGLAPREIYSLPYTKTFAWILRKARRVKAPVSYKHPRGAVVWVKLAPSISRRLE